MMTKTLTELHSDERLARTAAEIALDGYEGPGRFEAEGRPEFAALVSAGSELWLDTGDRAAAEGVWSPEIRGLTTNNTLINQVVQTGALDDTIRTVGQRMREAWPEMSPAGLVMEVAFVLNARIGLALVQRFGAKVSVELHPDIADDWEATVAFGKRYFAICPDHFIIKVPMTPAGFLAVRALSAAGVPVNYTLGFSARQNHFAAIFSRPAYVNVFLGRLGSLMQENGLGSGAGIGEKVTLASQETLERLRAEDPSISTRQIAASLRAAPQVAALAGVDVHTIPPKVARDYLDSSPDLSSIRRRSSGEFTVELPSDARLAAMLRALWEVTPEFDAFCRKAEGAADSLRSGRDLLRLAQDCGIGDFFRDWPVEEQLELRKGGKIPELGRWRDVAAVDDLMSQAALQSFAADQAELDERIGRLIF
jgi:transaldolase